MLIDVLDKNFSFIPVALRCPWGD